MDKADHAMQITRRLLEVAVELDVPNDVLALALIGAGIMLLAEVDPAVAEAIAATIDSHGTH